MNKNEILKAYGTDYKAMTYRLLSKADLASYLSPSMRIGIKPNLVTPTPPDYGATTHPEIICGIIEYLQEHGIYNITVLEGAWIGDKTSEAFEYCGYNSIAQKYNVRLFDTQKDASFKSDCSGLTLNLCKGLKEIYFLINVPVLKGHCQTKITCALKNMKGLIPISEKRRLHYIGIHKPIAQINTGIHQDFIVVDHICGDVDFEEGGNPVVRNCIMAAKDPVLVDSYVCSLLGYDVDEVPYVRLAENLRIGCADLSKATITTIEGKDSEPLYAENKVLSVSYAVEDTDSCSACYAMLIPALIDLKNEGLLDRLDTKIAIGQVHRGKSGNIGIGSCTSGFDYSISGCPPTSKDIYKGLKEFLIESSH